MRSEPCAVVPGGPPFLPRRAPSRPPLPCSPVLPHGPFPGLANPQTRLPAGIVSPPAPCPTQQCRIPPAAHGVICLMHARLPACAPSYFRAAAAAAAAANVPLAPQSSHTARLHHQPVESTHVYRPPLLFRPSSFLSARSSWHSSASQDDAHLQHILFAFPYPALCRRSNSKPT